MKNRNFNKSYLLLEISEGSHFVRPRLGGEGGGGVFNGGKGLDGNMHIDNLYKRHGIFVFV